MSETTFGRPILLANFFVIPMEEQELERSFGEPYVEYKRRVRRWL